jgi:hypothetical protein
MSVVRSSVPTLLHPASGLLILALDWLLFSGTVFSLGLSTPALAAIGFMLGGAGVAWIQSRYGDDGTTKSLLKGGASGLLVGVPFPIAGTAAGGLILGLSGLNRLRSGSDDGSSGTETDPSLPDRSPGATD